VDLVVHLASVVHRSSATLEELADVNVRGTQRVAEEAAGAGVSHFIFLSSIAAVGTGGGQIIDEHTDPHPITRYGESKLRAESELFRVAATTSMVASVLRPPMVYGPGMKGNPLRLFRALDRRLPLPLAGARNHRSSLFVDNLVAGICCLARCTPTTSGVYHIADREIVSTEAFARACANALGVHALLLPSPYALLRVAGRLGERLPLVAKVGLTTAFAESIGGSLVLDTSRLERETGFVPPYSQHEGLAATARWFRESCR
jgi:nucleoside-diphosphate-sugar epimerase